MRPSFESVGKWCSAHRQPREPKRKTERWEIFPATDKPGDGPGEFAGTTLGEVRWYTGWRRYAFFPEGGSWYEPDCLRAIADFCERKTAEQKATRKAQP